MTTEEWTQALVGAIGIEWWRIPIVVLSAIVIYLVFYLLIHIFGPRILTGSTSFDAAVIIMLGAVAGRVVIGHPPTLAAGVIGLVTLVLMEVCFGALNSALSKSTKYPALGLNKRPVVVFAHGKKIDHYARRARVTDQDLAFAFRRSGVAGPAQVQCAIMEPNGSISVIREGETIDSSLLEGVVGQEFLLPEDDTLD
ncbi:DUF421 domain-containing protein [Dermabacter sp. p3-SID358]|uniref:DUF421 domain-containing protein n=1 Tax=Dermabacter sp. p3-SID358 TaxID=2916114 RepID=UPI0021A362B1|nr:YetF domain-containing protein [Dermabacter sp. p3-SID358]MCT1867139.1 DUF421 domain-containing protein [Dermabacter sp. p3-SID358]